MLAVLADTLLLEKDRSRRLFLNDRAYDEHDQERNDTSDQSDQDIKKALDKALQGRRVVDRCRKNGRTAQFFRETLNAVSCHIRYMEVRRDRHDRAVIHQFDDPLIRKRRVDIHGIDPLADDIVGNSFEIRNDRIIQDLFQIRFLCKHDSGDHISDHILAGKALKDPFRILGRRHHEDIVPFSPLQSEDFDHALP